MNQSPLRNMQNWTIWANSSINTTSGTIPRVGSCISKRFWSTFTGRSMIGKTFSATKRAINADMKAARNHSDVLGISRDGHYQVHRDDGGKVCSDASGMQIEKAAGKQRAIAGNL